MERVYLSRKEFQEIMEVNLPKFTEWLHNPELTLDPELVGRRVFTYQGVEFVEKLETEE